MNISREVDGLVGGEGGGRDGWVDGDGGMNRSREVEGLVGR